MLANLTPIRRRAPVASMLSAVLEGHESISIQEAPLPLATPGSVRVRLEGCGICASNLPVWEGRPWFHYPCPPGTPGHEGWGFIDAIGQGVSGFQEGDRVTFLSGCSFATCEIVPARALVKIPPQLSAHPLPGEPLGCAMNVFRRSRIREGHTVAIVGAGFLGNLLVHLAARSGARVIAISRRPFALETARRFGAEAALPLNSDGSVLRQVEELTKGKLCHRVIEATGTQEALELSALLTMERGRLIIAGYHQDGPRQVDMQLWNWRGIDVINAHERNPVAYLKGMREAVQALCGGWLVPWSLFTHSLPLDRLGEAMHLSRSRPPDFMKALVLTGGNTSLASCRTETSIGC